MTRFIMAEGGSHAWDYVVYFDGRRVKKQTQVSIERYPFHFHDREKVSGKLITNTENNSEVRLVDSDYECEHNEEDIIYPSPFPDFPDFPDSNSDN